MGDLFGEYIKTDDALFHYTRYERALLILCERKLRLSLKGEMIDPNEFMPGALGFTKDFFGISPPVDRQSKRPPPVIFGDPTPVT